MAAKLGWQVAEAFCDVLLAGDSLACDTCMEALSLSVDMIDAGVL